MSEVDSIQEQIGNVSREMEFFLKKRTEREMLKITVQQIDNILEITCHNRKARLDTLQQKC